MAVLVASVDTFKDSYFDVNGSQGAQDFLCSDNYTLDSVKIYVSKQAAVSGNLYAKIYAHTGTFGTDGKPTGSALATSDAVAFSSVALYGTREVTLNFSSSNRILLEADTYYCVVIMSDTSSTGMRIYLSYQEDPTNIYGTWSSSSDGSSWSVNTNMDMPYFVYGIEANDPIASSVNTSSTKSATLNGKGTLSKSISTYSSESATIAGKGAITATRQSQSTESASLRYKPSPIASVVQSLASVSGTLTRKHDYISSSINTGSTKTAVLSGKGNLSKTISTASSESATLDARKVFYVSSSKNSSTTTSVAITAPTGILNDDILICVISSYRSTSAVPGTITAPAGWTQLGAVLKSTYYRFAMFWKRANSESGNYTFTSTSATQMQGAIGLYRGAFLTGDPSDVFSNTAYTTSNTTVRAATITPNVPYGILVWGGWYYLNGTISLSAPSGMSSRQSQTNTRNVVTLADLGYSTVGASGSKDGTAGANATVKHAFMVALKPQLPTSPVTATENSVTTESATLRAKKIISATESTLSSESATLVGKGRITKTITTGSSESAIVSGIGSLSAIVNTASTETASLQYSINISPISATQSSATTQTASLKGKGSLSGTLSGATSESGYLYGKLQITLQISTGSSVYSSLHGAGSLASVIATASTEIAVIRAKGALELLINCGATLIGQLHNNTNLGAVCSGLSTASGSLSASGKLQAITTSQSDVNAVISAAGAIAAITANITTQNGTLSGRGAAVALINNQAVANSTLNGKAYLSVIVNTETTVQSSLRLIGKITATFTNVATHSGTLSAKGSLISTLYVFSQVVASLDIVQVVDRIKGDISGYSILVATISAKGRITVNEYSGSTGLFTLIGHAKITSTVNTSSQLSNTAINARGELVSAITGKSVSVATLIRWSESEIWEAISPLMLEYYGYSRMKLIETNSSVITIEIVGKSKPQTQLDTPSIITTQLHESSKIF